MCKAVCMCVHMHVLSHVQLFSTPWTVACQVPLSMGFSRQKYWSGLPFPTPGIFLNQGSNPCLLDSFTAESPGKPSVPHTYAFLHSLICLEASPHHFAWPHSYRSSKSQLRSHLLRKLSVIGQHPVWHSQPSKAVTDAWLVIAHSP